MSNQEIDQLVLKTKELLAASNPEDALKLLSHYSENEAYVGSVKYLNILGETLLENSEVEEAYNVYYRSIELDPQGTVSVDAFFNLGQIIGGAEGLRYIMKGCDIVSDTLDKGDGSGAEDKKFVLKKVIQGIFAQIEIWMTDLCMEEEAEAQCEKLITKAIELDEGNAESWSLLASIRISQQQPEEAKTHIAKSWELFNSKKQHLEDSADMSNQTNDSNNDTSLTDSNVEYIELIQPLLTLTKLAIEVGLFDIAATISSNIHDISDDLLEPFYLEAFSNYLAAKTLQYKQDVGSNSTAQQNGEDFNKLQAINDLKLKIDSDGSGLNGEITEYINNALFALLNGSRIMYADETADPEIKSQIGVLIQELGGKQALKRVEKANKNVAVNEDNWEDEIVDEE